MNLAELGRALAAIGIDGRVVALGGRADMAWCVEEVADGGWEVYWYERGNQIGLVRLADETQACHQLLGRLTYSQPLAGAIETR